MIKYLAVHLYTMGWFLQEWGRDLQDEIVMQDYRGFLEQRKQKRFSTCIFSDLERLNANGLKRLANVWRQLEDHGVRLLNHPEKALMRLPLLNRLYEAGINDFNAYPVVAGRSPRPVRFPVFLRDASDHEGPKTDLIHGQEELEACIRQLGADGKLGASPIVTEFTSVMDDDGQYLKYGAFRIGDSIVPAHINAGQHWMVKASNSGLDVKTVDRETDYVRSNPHETALMNIFRLASIDYGRIDYGVRDGRIQVFEINTNPTVMWPGNPVQPERLARKQYVADRLVAAFRRLDAPG